MFDKIRDVSAIFTLEHELGRLREAYLDAVLEGRAPETSFWTDGEERVFTHVREAHFSRPVRVLMDPEDKRTDDEAWKERDSVVGEEAALWSHRRLKEIPFVGDGTHDDTVDSPDPTPPGATPQEDQAGGGSA
ncbi:MAG: hypothetical protein HKO65_14835 [Gemmatimonadetes bacterium]|nr:hypothetical protein [Gemmatimonadota bacterium]NNM06365.1 hypothetical protein [Gemmatimonadota bacterium]